MKSSRNCKKLDVSITPCICCLHLLWAVLHNKTPFKQRWTDWTSWNSKSPDRDLQQPGSWRRWWHRSTRWHTEHCCCPHLLTGRFCLRSRRPATKAQLYVYVARGRTQESHFSCFYIPDWCTEARELGYFISGDVVCLDPGISTFL